MGTLGTHTPRSREAAKRYHTIVVGVWIETPGRNSHPLHSRCATSHPPRISPIPKAEGCALTTHRSSHITIVHQPTIHNWHGNLIVLDVSVEFPCHEALVLSRGASCLCGRWERTRREAAKRRSGTIVNTSNHRCHITCFLLPSLFRVLTCILTCFFNKTHTRSLSA